jgi:hypothetical protein
MASPNGAKAAPPLGDRDLRDDHRLGQLDGHHIIHNDTRPQVPRYHVDSVWRRPKSLEELRDGLELTELYDRRHPGRLAGRR